MPDPKGRIIELITVGNVIDYYAGKDAYPDLYKISFDRWLSQRGLTKFLNRSLREYLNHHLSATRRILEEIGMNSKTVNYAATPHPSYFGLEDRTLLPQECRILEVADKFNALIQSEGIRHYTNKKMRVEALNIIVQELREEFGEHTKESFGHYALSFIVRKYLLLEVQTELLPKVNAMIAAFQRGSRPSEPEKKEATRVMTVITATITLDEEFGHVLDHDMIAKLRFDLTELKREFQQPMAGAVA